jgi:hypothetical protein
MRPILFFSLLSFFSSIDGRPASRTAKAQQNQKKRTVNARIYVLFTEQRRSSEGGAYEQGVNKKEQSPRGHINPFCLWVDWF